MTTLYILETFHHICYALLSSHAYIRNILQSHFIHSHVQLYFFRRIVHGASGLTYKIKQEPQAHTLEQHTTYNNMATTINPFNTLFADKDINATERSLRAHKGVLTKITCYIDREEERGRRHRNSGTRPTPAGNSTLPEASKSQQDHTRRQRPAGQDTGGTQARQAEKRTSPR